MTPSPPAGFHANPGYDPARVPPATRSLALEFHRARPDYRPSPLHTLPQLAESCGVGFVLVKDESDRFGMPAFKILGASWAVEQALRANPRTTMVVAASDGNHGRAVARCAWERELDCRIFLPASTPSSAVTAIAAEGARIEMVPGSYDVAVEEAARAASEPGCALVADVSGENDVPSVEWVVEGYHTMFAEITAQCADQRIDLVLVPVGVGSLATAAVHWALGQDRPVDVIGVEPTEAACVTASLTAGSIVSVATGATTMAGLNCGTPSYQAWPTISPGLAGTVVVDDDEVDVAMALLAEHGVVLGPCGGASVAALRRLVGGITDAGRAVLPTRVPIGAGTSVLLLGTEGRPEPSSGGDALG